MRIVIWTDDDGYRRRALVRDEDADAVAWEGRGITQDPPDISTLDWEQIKRSLHNQLVDRGLISFQDVQEQQNGLSAAVIGTMKPYLLALYKQ